MFASEETPDVVASTTAPAAVATFTATMPQIGDVLLAAAFVSYAGPFNAALRTQLVEQCWRPDLVSRCIPMSEGVRPLDLLADDASRAKWANEGLPIDPLSVENGAIMTNASRWPLMIDPQLQVCLHRTAPCNDSMHYYNNHTTTLVRCGGMCLCL